jgi:hypothetical protein
MLRVPLNKIGFDEKMYELHITRFQSNNNINWTAILEKFIVLLKNTVFLDVTPR